MSNEFFVEVRILPILVKNQKERHQNLVRMTACEKISDEVVGLYMEKAKSFVFLLVMLSVLSDEALLSLPKIINGEDATEGSVQLQVGNVLVATETKTDEPSPSYVDFEGSHRVFYATVDAHRVHGEMIHAFKQQLRAVAKFHSWIVVVD